MEIKQLFALLGIIVFILLLMYNFRRIIYLTFIRIVYGHYSYDYFNKYKSYFVRSPFQYCFRDDFVAHLLCILSKQEELPSFKSGKEIYFEDTPYFINYKDFLKKKGKPDCFNAYHFNNPDFEIKALGYQENIAGSKSTIVFYFMNNSFFMGEYIFRNPKTDIKASLVDHFLNARELPAENFYIENTKNRIIHYQNTGFTVDIKYLNRENEVIMHNLNKYFVFITGKKLDMHP